MNLRRLLPRHAAVTTAVLLVACSLFAAFSAAPAGAQEARAGNGNGGSTTAEQPIAPGEYVESWALAPTGVDPSEPSTRATLVYSLAPGGAVDDSVTLWNYSPVAINFTVYPTDAFNNATGDFSLLKGTQAPKDVGTWIALGTTQVLVPAHTSVTIPVKITVPEKATPGDHAGAILASSQAVGTDPNGAVVNLDRRTGSRVYVRVKGTVDPSLVVQDLSSKYHGSVNPFSGDLDVSYTVTNEGNVRLGAQQRLVAKDIFGRTLASKTLPPIGEILPDNTVRYTATLGGVPAAVLVKTSLQLTPTTPKGAVATPLPASSASTRAWAIPWTIILVVLVLFLAWRVYRRWNEREEDAAPPSAGGAAGPGAGGPYAGGSGRVPAPPAGVGAPPGR